MTYSRPNHIHKATTRNISLCFSVRAADLGCEDVEVASPIGSADQLALVLWGDPGVLRHPHHGGCEAVGVEAEAVKRLTLLLAVALTCTRGKKGSQGQR